MRSPGVLRKVALFLLIIVAGNLDLATGETLPVCYVLSHLETLKGKIIEVQGLLGGGRRHGMILQDSTQSESCPTIEHGGNEWPPAIALTEVTRNADIEDGPVTFESDESEIHGKLARPRRIVEGHPDLAIKATIVGELRARAGIVILRSEDGWYEGNGYAQGGQCGTLSDKTN